MKLQSLIKMAMLNVIAIFALLFFYTAVGEEVSFGLTWDEPVQWTNTNPVISGDIVGYKVYYQVNGEVGKESLYWVIDKSDKEVSGSIDLAYSTEPYTIQFVIVVVDKYGNESDFSNVLEQKFTVYPSGKINPPSSLKVFISCVECIIKVVD